jgi:hypothetical protein
MLYQIERCVLGKDNDQIDALERGQNITPFRVGANRSGRPFEPAHGLVAVDTDDQCIRGVPRCRENVNVAGMEKIENAVGERDLTFARSAPTFGLNPCCNFA